MREKHKSGLFQKRDERYNKIRFKVSLSTMQTIDSKQCPLSPEVLEKLHGGETLALEGDGAVVAFIVPAHPGGEKRPFGLCRGEFTVPGGFNEPDPELEALFYGAASDR